MNTDTHPTPVHIRSCITQRMIEAMKETGQIAPTWVSAAIQDGISDACREHDGAKQ